MPWFGGGAHKGGPPWIWAGESAEGLLASVTQEVPEGREASPTETFNGVTDLISTEMPTAPAQAHSQISKLEEIK